MEGRTSVLVGAILVGAVLVGAVCNRAYRTRHICSANPKTK